MAKATVRNKTSVHLSVPAPFNALLPPGGSKTVRGVNLEELGTSAELTSMIQRGRITVESVHDDTIDDTLEAPNISIFAFATTALRDASTVPAGTLGYVAADDKHYRKTSSTWEELGGAAAPTSELMYQGRVNGGAGTYYWRTTGVGTLTKVGTGSWTIDFSPGIQDEDLMVTLMPYSGIARIMGWEGMGSGVITQIEVKAWDVAAAAADAVFRFAIYKSNLTRL